MAQPGKNTLDAMLASVNSENRSEFRPHTNQVGAEIIDWENAKQDAQSGVDSVSENDIQPS